VCDLCMCLSDIGEVLISVSGIYTLCIIVGPSTYFNLLNITSGGELDIGIFILLQIVITLEEVFMFIIICNPKFPSKYFKCYNAIKW